VEVDEETEVVVRIRAEQNVAGDCDDAGLTTTLQVELARPLGDRSIAGASGAPSCVVDGRATDRCHRAAG
jgi:hypothetical protein